MKEPAHLSCISSIFPSLVELRLRLGWYDFLYFASHVDYSCVVPFKNVRILELSSFRGQIEPDFLMAHFPNVCMFTMSIRKPRDATHFVPPAPHESFAKPLASCTDLPALAQSHTIDNSFSLRLAPSESLSMLPPILSESFSEPSLPPYDPISNRGSGRDLAAGFEGKSSILPHDDILLPQHSGTTHSCSRNVQTDLSGPGHYSSRDQSHVFRPNPPNTSMSSSILRFARTPGVSRSPASTRVASHHVVSHQVSPTRYFREQSNPYMKFNTSHHSASSAVPHRAPLPTHCLSSQVVSNIPSASRTEDKFATLGASNGNPPIHTSQTSSCASLASHASLDRNHKGSLSPLPVIEEEALLLHENPSRRADPLRDVTNGRLVSLRHHLPFNHKFSLIYGYTYDSLLMALRYSLPKSVKILCLDSPIDGDFNFKRFIHNFQIDLLRLATVNVNKDRSHSDPFESLRATYFGIPTHMRPQFMFCDHGPKSYLNWERSHEFVWRNLVEQRLHEFLT